jgi:alanine racemase
MGYADGIPRIARTAGIWSAGKRAPIIGRVSMDQFVVELGSDSKAKSGRLGNNFRQWLTR